MEKRPALIEREVQLRALHEAFARARDGQGGLVLVSGEAGAGKSSLVREFVAGAAGRPSVLFGWCDPMESPRPLGPLLDAAASADDELARRLTAGVDRAEAFAVALELVGGVAGRVGPATVLVVEDAHWADEATLDLITFLGRRVHALATLVIVTFRDDEVAASHPLRLRFGELATAIRARVHVPPLSVAGLTELATGTGVDVDTIHRLTGGNPFFVSEWLAGGDIASEAPPESVRDAVLARAARLPTAARALLDVAAIVPGRVERWLLDALGSDVDVTGGLDECVARGLVELDGGHGVLFRHELARVAIADAIPHSRAFQLHARALVALADAPTGPPDPARLAHHAIASGDSSAVLAHAPAAATSASSIGNHREAARHLEAAVGHATALPETERSDLYVRLASELATIERSADAVAACERALALAALAGDAERCAAALLESVRPLVSLGRQVEAEDRMDRAGQQLHGRPASRATAQLALMRATAHMLARAFAAAQASGTEAIAAASAVGADDLLANAHITTGINRVISGDVDDGLIQVRLGIDIAVRLCAHHLVTLGYVQIGSGCGELRLYAEAQPALAAGIAYANARELVSSAHYMSAWSARCDLETGEWEAAGTAAGALLRSPTCQGISRFVALVTLGWLRARRGDPDVAPLLGEALELARSTGHLQRLWPVAACRAEAAWLADELDTELDLVDEAAALAQRLDHPPAIEELAFWRSLAGRPAGRALISRARTPFGASAAGDHALAAARWADLGCPYEEAMAHLLDGRPDHLLTAHHLATRLDAGPLRRRAGGLLRDAGVSIPRGATATTRGNPFSLTEREIEVLAQVATGRTNPQIARELGITAKTVGHHVSSVLTKVGARSRSEAAVVAARLGLTAE